VGQRWQDLDFVFTTALGTPLDTRNATRYFQADLTRAGLPHQRFHDLHAYATLMHEAGEALATISKSLGHADLGDAGAVRGPDGQGAHGLARTPVPYPQQP
jgi:integrase